MQAALIDHCGSNDLVRVANIAVPTMAATDLLVQVRAASVNPLDTKTRDGKLKTLLKCRFPLVLDGVNSGDRMRLHRYVAL
jgi:alcohol dehydrogenase